MTRTFPAPDPLVRQIEDRRRQISMSYSQLATAAGLAYNTWRACVEGRRTPSIATLRAVAEAVGYRVELRPTHFAQAPTEAGERKP